MKQRPIKFDSEIKVSPKLIKLFNKLCLLVIKKQEIEFLKQVREIPPETINQLLTLSDADGSLLQIAALHLSEATFTALVNEVSSEGINQALSHKRPKAWSTLQTIARLQGERAFITLLGKASREQISKDIRFQDELGSTSLHLAARYQSEQAFSSLLMKSNCDDLSVALLLKNKNGTTALQIVNHYQKEHVYYALSKISSDIKKIINVVERLCYLATTQQDNEFLQLIENDGSSLIDHVLTLKNNDGEFILQNAARYLQKDTFKKLLAKASPQIINQALFFQNKNQELALQTIICHQDAATFLTLLKNINSNALNKALLHQDFEGWTILQMVALFLNEETFMVLLKNITIVTLEKAIILSNKDGFNALELAIRNLGEAAIITLFNSINPAILNTALFPPNKSVKSVIDTICISQSKKTLDTLFTKLPKLKAHSIIKDAIAFGENLQTSANQRNNRLFQQLLESASQEQLNLTLMLDNGTLILANVILFLDSASFINLLNKASFNAINNALISSDFLKTACKYLNSENFIALLAKASPRAINQAIRIHRDDILRTVAHNRSENDCIALFNILPDRVPSVILTAKMLTAVCTNQPVNVVVHLLKRMSKKDLVSLFSQVTPLESLLVSIVTIFNQTDWDDPISCAITEKILDAAKPFYSSIIELVFTDYYIHGHPFPKVNQAIDLLVKLINTQPSTAKTRALLVNLNKSVKPLSEDKISPAEYDSFFHAPFPCIYLANQTRYEHSQLSALTELNVNDFINDLITHGLATWCDFIKLRQQLPALVDVFDFLIKNQLKGTTTLYGPLPFRSREGNLVINAFLAGKALIKTFPSKYNLLQHTANLKDPIHNCIPQLRAVVSANSTHKFYHQSAEIKPYQINKPGLVKQYKTQKTSATLISHHLHTKLFGSNHTNQELIGLVYKADPTLDKAWLARDRGTYNHKWIGTKSEVIKYSEYISNVNYTDYEAFINNIDKNTNTTNEVLTHVTKERLLAVVIGRDTPAARKLAADYVEIIKNELNIELPIIFYNSTHRTVLEYNTRAKQEDKLKALYPDFSFTKEEKAKTKVLTRFRFNTPPSISNEIKKAQKAEDSDYIASTQTWVETEKKVRAMKF